MRILGKVAPICACAVSLACGNGKSTQGGIGVEPPNDGLATPAAPIVSGDFTFYGAAQGLPPDVRDVSADEGGNLYVAARDALFVRAKGARDFVRVDPDAAALTKNCWPEGEIANPKPAGAPFTCPVISVAGAAAGKAVVGFQGVGIDNDYDAPWALDSGGADVVTFDGKTVKRERHVLVASPPKTVCEHWVPGTNNTVCNETWSDSPWVAGRKKLRQVQRILVNHDRSRPLSYGDVYMAGTHASFTILVAHPKERGWVDKTDGYPEFADARYVWEHHHPNPESTNGQFLAGEAWALALDPRSNVPWFANQFRMASMPDYVHMSQPLTVNGWWGDMVPDRPHMALWYPASPQDPSRRDNVQSLSFCDDGTLWVASLGNGLGRIDPSGAVSYVDMPPGTYNRALAVACDPLDGSVWVGFEPGGFGRYQAGKWSIADAGPGWASANGVRSIQIDRWSSPRAVLFAHQGKAAAPGGVTIYTGP
jgi:hypothetical protein